MVYHVNPKIAYQWNRFFANSKEPLLLRIFQAISLTHQNYEIS